MRAVALALMVLLLACAPTPDGAGDVRLSVEPESLSAGDSITLELSNGSAEPVAYNLCTSELEQLSDGEWQAVPPGLHDSALSPVGSGFATSWTCLRTCPPANTDTEREWRASTRAREECCGAARSAWRDEGRPSMAAPGNLSRTSSFPSCRSRGNDCIMHVIPLL